MQKKQLISLLSYAAVAGNIIFVLWGLYNGIREGFEATLPEKVSYLGLTSLLIVNSLLLLINIKKVEKQC